jgi:hypothetical protein
MDNADDDEVVRRIIEGVDELNLPPPSPVDNIVREILDSFTSIEECNIVAGQQKHADVTKYFETNPELLALVKADDNYFLAEETTRYVALHGMVSQGDVARIVAALFRSAELNAVDQGETSPDTIKALCANFPKQLSGGLALIKDETFWKIPTPTFNFLPEDLSAWQQLHDTNYMPWIGEGSYPNIIVQGDNFEIWPIGEIAESEFMSDPGIHACLNRTQLKVALENVRQDTRDFLVPLRSWAMRFYPADEEELVACFTKAFVDSNGD